MYVQSIQISPNITQYHKLFAKIRNSGTAYYVFLRQIPPTIEGIYGGNTAKKSIFRPLYVEPYLSPIFIPIIFSDKDSC